MGLGLFLFSAVDTGAKFLTTELHPLQIVWTRQLGLLVGAVFLLLRYGLPVLQTKYPKLQLLRGCMAVLSASLFIFAIAHMPLADAVAISFVAPFIVTLLGAMVLKESVGIRRWVAISLGFLGALIVIRPGLGVMHPAAGLVIVAALFFAIRQIISRAVSDTDRTSTTVIYTAFVSTLLLTVPLPFVWQTPTAEQVFVLMLIAVLAALAEVCVIKALELALAVIIAPMHYTLILWGTFYGWVVFGQFPDVWTWVGTTLIVATGIYSLRREYLESMLIKA